MTAVKSVKLAIEKTNGVTQPVPLPGQDSFLLFAFQCSPGFLAMVVFCLKQQGFRPFLWGDCTISLVTRACSLLVMCKFFRVWQC